MKDTNKKGNIIQEKTFTFALSIIELYQKMQQKNEYVLSKQLLRSATSIGANVNEATAAQTKRDFIAKMSIASKEARETSYWLHLLNKSKLADVVVKQQINDCDEIIRILTAIVKSAQTNH